MTKESSSTDALQTRKTGSDVSLYPSKGVVRLSPLIGGIGLVITGLGGVLLAPRVGSFLYQNHYRLPGALKDEIYPELYGLEIYQAQFLNWALWPASVLVVLGLLLVSYNSLSQPLRAWLASRNGEVALWVIVAVGVVIRIRALLEQRSLWLDESFVAANLPQRDLFELFAVPLDFGQSAPPGFLLMIWISYRLFGASEVALRLAPFLFGVGAVVLAKFAATKLFRSDVARITFLGIVSFSPVLVYYSQELKQYSVDAFATVAAIWMLANWGSQRNSWLFGLIGAILVQFSLASFFVLLALGLTTLIPNVRQEGLLSGITSLLQKHLKVFLIWLAGGLIHGWYLLVAGTNREAMRDWWVSAGGFPPQELSAIGPWLIESLQKLAWLTLGHTSIASVDVKGPEIVTLAVVTLVGFGLLVSNVVRTFSVTLLSVTLVLGFLQIYPYFVGRLNLYLVPMIALILANLAERLHELRLRRLALPAGRVVALTALIPLFMSLIIFGRPEDKQDMRWLITEYELRHESRDILTTPDELIYGWYSLALQADHPDYVTQETVIDNPEDFSSETIWIISTHYSADPIITALAQTHRLECEATPRFTRLQILKPITTSNSPEGFCNFIAPKL